eukprot:m.91331 g.91331  ORF g.91331 m.91331 type:complete len:228 (+) comp16487_c0_seq2:233-916(+)
MSDGTAKELSIGVLALQGAFAEHVKMLNTIPGVSAREVRTDAELLGLDGIVLPGGESTTMGLIAERSGILPALRGLVHDKKLPVFATCAGLILLADKALHEKDGGQPLIGGLGVVVDRNHFGSQLYSFESELEVTHEKIRSTACADAKHKGIFIRAPAIVDVTAPDVQVLARLPEFERDDGNGGKTQCIVAAQKGEQVLVISFHPELSRDATWHTYFIENLVRKGTE